MDRYTIPSFAIEDGERLAVTVMPGGKGWTVQLLREGFIAYGALTQEAIETAAFEITLIFLDGLRTQIALLKEARG